MKDVDGKEMELKWKVKEVEIQGSRGSRTVYEIRAEDGAWIANVAHKPIAKWIVNSWNNPQNKGYSL